MPTHLMQNVLDWVTAYGYVAIFLLLVFGIVGLPVPDEMLLTFAGYLVARGDLRLAPTIASAFLGSISGITLSYLLGHSAGVYLLERYGGRLHLPPETMDRVHHWFQHLGRWTLVIGYFVPGVRHGTAYVAGASRLEYPQFAWFAYLGGLLWSSCFISLGYFMGEEWPKISGSLHRVYLLIWPLAAGALVVYLIRRAKRSS